MATKWLDTPAVVWLDTTACVWKDVDFLSASLAQEAFDEIVFDNVADVTPSDTTILKVGHVFVGSTGIIKVRSAHNKLDILLNVLTAGSWVKFRVDRVYSSSTAATDIVHAF